MTDIRRDGIMECRKKTYTKKGNYNKKESRKDESTEWMVAIFAKYCLKIALCLFLISLDSFHRVKLNYLST